MLSPNYYLKSVSQRCADYTSQSLRQVRSMVRRCICTLSLEAIMEPFVVGPTGVPNHHSGLWTGITKGHTLAEQGMLEKII